MPLRGYFAYAGGMLLALLFLIDCYLPRPVVAVSHADIDRSIIRIHSMQKWPSAVVFDTSQPTIVAPTPLAAEAPAVAAEASVASAPREAFAFAQEPKPAPATTPPAAPATASKPPTRRVRVARARSPRIAIARSARIASYEQPNYEVFGFRPPFPGSW